MPNSRRYAELVTPVIDGLYRFALRLTRDAGHAEDLLQQGLLTGLLKLDQLGDDGAFRAWISRIVFRTWLNRRAKRTEEPMEPAELDRVVPLRPGPEQAVDAARLGARVRDALDGLPDEQRDAVWLVDGQGFTYAEAAMILDIRPGTAASRVARGRAALQEALQDVAREHGVIR